MFSSIPTNAKRQVPPMLLKVSDLEVKSLLAHAVRLLA